MFKEFVLAPLSALPNLCAKAMVRQARFVFSVKVCRDLLHCLAVRSVSDLWSAAPKAPAAVAPLFALKAGLHSPLPECACPVSSVNSANPEISHAAGIANGL